MAISIHRAVMAAREERLKSPDDHKSGNVFVKLGAWIGGGVVLLVWYVSHAPIVYMTVSPD